MSDQDDNKPELVPIDYSRYRKAELQEMCRKRNPPLPTTGSVPELIDRLGRDDQRTGNTPMVPAPQIPEPDLSFLVKPPEQPETTTTTSPVTAPPVQEVAATAPPQTTGPDECVTAPAIRGELVRPGTYQATYPCPGELSTSMHQLYLDRVNQDAAAAGHTVRGGAYRSGWSGDGDQRHAVYQVSVRKE